MENEQQNVERLNPWLHIWVKPRAVIRQELDKSNREKNFILLAIIIGMLTAITAYEQQSFGLNYGLMALIVLIGGPVLGIITLYFGSWINAVVGRWIGGVGRASDLRVSMLRGSMVPSLATVAISLVDLLIRGEEYFVSVDTLVEVRGMNILDMVTGGTPPILVLLSVIAFIWLAVVNLKSIGEAHGFSAWMALLTGVIIAAILVIPFMILGMIVAAFFIAI